LILTPGIYTTWGIKIKYKNNNNNNNNNLDNIYSAVIMAEPFARVHSVHAMNTDTAPGAANLSTKPIGLSRRPAYVGSQ